MEQKLLAFLLDHVAEAAVSHAQALGKHASVAVRASHR